MKPSSLTSHSSVSPRALMLAERRKPNGTHISGTAQAVRSGPVKNLCDLRRDTGGLAPCRLRIASGACGYYAPNPSHASIYIRENLKLMISIRS